MTELKTSPSAIEIIKVALLAVILAVLLVGMILYTLTPLETPEARGTMQTWTAYTLLSKDVYTTAAPLVGVGGFTTTTQSAANVAYISSSDGGFLYRFDGECPTATIGHSVPVDVTVILQGGGNIGALCFVASGTHADMSITLLK